MSGGDWREPGQAEGALAPRAHGGEILALAEGAIGEEPVRPADRAVRELHDHALADLALAQPEPEVALDDLQLLLRGGEEHLVARGADPERAPDAAGEVQGAGTPLVEPGGRH